MGSSPSKRQDDNFGSVVPGSGAPTDFSSDYVTSHGDSAAGRAGAGPPAAEEGQSAPATPARTAATAPPVAAGEGAGDAGGGAGDAGDAAVVARPPSSGGVSAEGATPSTSPVVPRITGSFPQGSVAPAEPGAATRRAPADVVLAGALPPVGGGAAGGAVPQLGSLGGAAAPGVRDFAVPEGDDEIFEDGILVTEQHRKEAKLLRFEREISEVGPGLCVSSQIMAEDREALRAKGITLVVNAAADVCSCYHAGDGELKYAAFYLFDHQTQELSGYLWAFVDLVATELAAGGRALVHCHQGVSRSGALAIAAMMWKTRASHVEMGKVAKAARGTISPNPGFLCQLMEWQTRLQPVTAAAAAADTPLAASLYRVRKCRIPFTLLRTVGTLSELVGVSPDTPDPVAVTHVVEERRDVVDRHLLSNAEIGSVLSGEEGATGCYVVRVGRTAHIWVGDRCADADEQRGVAQREIALWRRYEYGGEGSEPGVDIDVCPCDTPAARESLISSLLGSGGSVVPVAPAVVDLPDVTPAATETSGGSALGGAGGAGGAADVAEPVGVGGFSALPRSSPDDADAVPLHSRGAADEDAILEQELAATRSATAKTALYAAEGAAWEGLGVYDEDDLMPDGCYLLVPPVSHGDAPVVQCFLWVGEEWGGDRAATEKAAAAFVVSLLPDRGDGSAWSVAVSVESPEDESEQFWEVFESGY